MQASAFVLTCSLIRCRELSSTRTTLYLVFESPVRSGLLTLRGQDRDRDRSIGLPRLPKTGPNRCRPVYIGFLQSWTGLGLNRSRTGLGPGFRQICSSIICSYEYYL